jgi:inhibitor of KinA
MVQEYPKIKPVGDSSLLVEFEEEVSPEVNKKVRQLAHALEMQSFPGVGEVIPAYRSLMIFFDPLKVTLHRISSFVENLALDSVEIELAKSRIFKLPTVYGGVYGPDLERVSRHTKLSPDEIIRVFSSQAYLVYCLGFLCSLAYLGGVPEVLHVPRLDSPRPLVLAGSVGFSGPQANVVPIDQPSGFNYIGRSFVKVYDPHKFPPTLIRPGDYIQCPSVSEEDAKRAGEKDLGEYIEGI